MSVIGAYLQHNPVLFCLNLLLHFLIKALDLIIMCCGFPVWIKFRCEDVISKTVWAKLKTQSRQQIHFSSYRTDVLYIQVLILLISLVLIC